MSYEPLYIPNSFLEKPRNFDGVSVPEFDAFPTGQTIMMFRTPTEYVDRMNDMYDDPEQRKHFPVPYQADHLNLHTQHGLYDDNDFKVKYNFIPDDIFEWIKDRLHQYLQVIHFEYAGIRTKSSWICEYGANEFIKNHIHWGTGTNKLGLIGLMALKMPKNMGNETISEESAEFNKCGQIQFITSAGSSTFGKPIVTFAKQPGDFVIYPYDVCHCVYPHFNKNEIRRTMPINIDVYTHDRINAPGDF